MVTPGAGDLWPAIGKTTSTESVFGHGDEGRQPRRPRSVASVALYISHDGDLWNRVDTSDIGEGGAGEVDAITATPRQQTIFGSPPSSPPTSSNTRSMTAGVIATYARRPASTLLRLSAVRDPGAGAERLHDVGRVMDGPASPAPWRNAVDGAQ